MIALTWRDKLSRTRVAVDVKKGPHDFIGGQMVEEHSLVLIVDKVVHLSCPVDVERQPRTCAGIVLIEPPSPHPFLVGEVRAGKTGQVHRWGLGRILGGDSQADGTAPFWGLYQLQANFLAYLEGFIAEDNAIAKVSFPAGNAAIVGKYDGRAVDFVEAHNVMHAAP